MAEKQDFLRAMAALSPEEVVSMLPKEILEKVVSQAAVPVPHDAVNVGKASQTPAATSPPKKPLKALNAFIAFRSYYSKTFPTVAQKDISSLIKTLWQGDLFHAEWQIMAQLWSFIRDSNIQGLNVPLSSFLATSVPSMGVVPNDAYIQTLGWQLTQDGERNFRLVRLSNPSKSDIQATYQPTAASQAELMQWLAASGALGNHGQTLLNLLERRPDTFVPPVNNQTRPDLQQFVARIRSDPLGAAATMMGVDTTHPAVNLGVGVVHSNDFDNLNMSIGLVHVPYGSRTESGELSSSAVQTIPSPHAQPQDTQGTRQYPFDTGYSQITQHENSSFALDGAQAAAVDLSNPYDVDALIANQSDLDRPYLGHHFFQ
ncbi:hypothetical protein MKZ38_010029 [Zalerion maritima]|uniref:Alpha box domain-containing protein n=1 Tax=Zalerion maritima TaxID=339359 RepID=A0AAD5RU42_9PEZI|nr:hypothetical protein MKZ38_010029 [Zalerion maritima]